MQEKERARLQKELELAKKEKEVGLRVYQGMVDIKELLDVRKSHFSILVRNCCLSILFITHFYNMASPPCSKCQGTFFKISGIDIALHFLTQNYFSRSGTALSRST